MNQERNFLVQVECSVEVKDVFAIFEANQRLGMKLGVTSRRFSCLEEPH